MKIILKNSSFIILLIILFSCAKDDVYDKDNAISAFYQIDPFAPLNKEQDIKIESQKTVSNWNFGDNLHQGGRVGNFKKKYSYKKDQISLKKVANIWLDFDLIHQKSSTSDPVINDNNAYFLDDSGVLNAYDLNSFKKLWSKRIFKRLFFESYNNPKIFGLSDKIIAISGNNEVVAIDIKGENILWSKKLPALIVSKPIISDGLVYVACDKNELYALQAHDGKTLWSHSGILQNTAIFGAADPVIYGNTIFVSYSSGEIYALNKNNGQEIWSFDLNLNNKAVNSDFYLSDIDATPIVNNNVIYVVGNGGSMVAIKADSGDVLWQKQIATVIDFHLSGNFLYVINNDSKLIAINKENGDIKWLKQLNRYKNPKKPHTKIIYNSMIMAGDKILISDSLGKIFIIAPLTGEIEKEIKIGNKGFNDIIVMNDKIYLNKSNFFGSYFISLQ